MSVFKNKSMEDVCSVLKLDSKRINDLDITDGAEREMLLDIIKKYPGYFLAVNEDNMFEGLVKLFLETNPTMFDKIPAKLRTPSIKMLMLKKMPSIIELFDVSDIDYETVKYLYVHYPFMLEDMEQDKQDKVNEIVSRLQKENVVCEFNNIEEE